jgi:hypothetical protein
VPKELVIPGRQVCVAARSKHGTYYYPQTRLYKYQSTTIIITTKAQFFFFFFFFCGQGRGDWLNGRQLIIEKKNNIFLGGVWGFN